MKLRRMPWAGHVADTGEVRNTYTIIVEKPDRKISLGRPRHGRIILKFFIKK
jgi:hypothetical protein